MLRHRAAYAHTASTLRTLRPPRCGPSQVACRVGVRVLSKPDCPLCDGLVGKLGSLQRKAAFTGGFWADATVEVLPLARTAAPVQLR